MGAMKYDLAVLAKRAAKRRRSFVVLRDIVPPAVFSTNLYLACYKPALDVWARYVPRILDQYERTLSSMTTDAAADVQGEIGQAQSELQRLVLLLRPSLRDWALRTEGWFRGKWRGAVLSATGVDLQTLIGPEDVQETLETIVEWNVNLVRDVSDQARQRISNAVFDGLRNRTPAREVAAKIQEATGMAKRRSVAIASDQLTKLTSSLASERRREAGIDKWQWRHSGKLHPREDHKARNGKIYDDETAPQDPPGRLPYCGCRELAVIEFD
jgi:uncharacterized protein with gpF-like domain